MTATNDSSDLEALFDSIAADVSKPAPVAAKPVVDTGSDSDDLQALFDSVSAMHWMFHPVISSSVSLVTVKLVCCCLPWAVYWSTTVYGFMCLSFLTEL